MDSLQKFKGYAYGKVQEPNHHHHIEDQQQQPRKPVKTLNVVVFIFATLFLCITLSFAIATIIHHLTSSSSSNTESTESPNSLNSSSLADSVRVVCSVTRFPKSCFATIISSEINATAVDPESILESSLRISIDELAKLASSLAASQGPAMEDCRDQVADAVSRLNDSLSVVAAAGGVKGLTEAEIADVRTWVSAAMTDQETCLDGMEEMGSAAEEVKRKVERCGEYTSNSLAIVTNFKTLMEKFHHFPLH